jgi:hypothetical protein
MLANKPSLASAAAGFDLHIFSLDPAQPMQRHCKGLNPPLVLWIVAWGGQQYRDAPKLVLAGGCDWPRTNAPNQTNKFPPPHARPQAQEAHRSGSG